MLQTQWRDRNRIVLTAVIAITMTSTAIGQRPRVSSRETNRQTTGDYLDSIERGAPRYDLSNDDRRPALTEIDVSKVDRRAVGNLLKDGLAEAKRLYTSLQQDIRSGATELRSVAGEVDRLRAYTSYLVEDLEGGQQLERLLPAIQQLDTDWRLLSHRLGQSPRISNASLDILDRIDGIGRQVGKLFRLAPEVDRRSLVNQLAHIESAISNIADELEYVSRGRDVNHRDLIYDCRKASEHTRRIEDMLMDYASYERVVDEYQRFGSRWKLVERKLEKVQSPRIRRDLREVADIDDQIHDLLWLEKSADREQMRRTARALIEDVDEYFNRTPLKLLLHIKNAGPVLKTADDFYNSVRHFDDCIKDNKNNQELLECYRHVEMDGDRFVRAFQPLNSNTASVVLKEIDNGIHSLRAELNLSGSMTSIDTRALARTAAAMEALADDLNYDVSRWLQRERPSYRSDVERAMDRLVKQSRDFQRVVQVRPTLQELQRETSDLNDAWRDLHQYLGRCRTSERDHMVYLARDITKALYELQAPLDLLASR